MAFAQSTEKGMTGKTWEVSKAVLHGITQERVIASTLISQLVKTTMTIHGMYFPQSSDGCA